MLPKNFKDYRCVLITFTDEAEFLKEQSKDFFKDTENINFMTVEETLPLLSRKSDYLFYKKKKSSFFGTLRYDVLLIAAVLLGCVLLFKAVEDRRAYLRNLKKYMSNELAIVTKSNQFKQKKKELAAIVANKPADTFLLLEDFFKRNRCDLHPDRSQDRNPAEIKDRKSVIYGRRKVFARSPSVRRAIQ
jgi:hypothetical protein